MSLRVRLVVVVGTLVAVTVAVVSSLAWWLAAREIREPTDDLIERRTDLLVQAAADTDSDATIAGTTLDGLRRALDFDLLGGEVFLQYLGADGEPVSEVVMPVTDDDRRIARAGDAPVWRTDDVDGVTLRIRTTAMPGGALTLGEDVSAGERAIDDLRDRLVVVGLVGVAVAVAVAVVVARRIATPVARVADAAEDLASGAAPPAGSKRRAATRSPVSRPASTAWSRHSRCPGSSSAASSPTRVTSCGPLSRLFA